jgi:hypothetical protein
MRATYLRSHGARPNLSTRLDGEPLPVTITVIDVNVQIYARYRVRLNGPQLVTRARDVGRLLTNAKLRPL